MSEFSVAQGRIGSDRPIGVPRVSIIIPVLNEAGGVVDCLLPLQRFRHNGDVELIVVDGGSDDDSEVLAAPLCDRLVVAARGRAAQMNAGADASRGRLLLFLHVDTELPDGDGWLQRVSVIVKQGGWGFFSVNLSGDEIWARVISLFINWRSRLTDIATGDQCIFVERQRFFQLGGYPPIPLMEDIALSKLLKRAGLAPFNPGLKVTTSTRRWRRNGVVKTVLLMWLLRSLYALGASPRRLHRLYYGT